MTKRHEEWYRNHRKYLRKNKIFHDLKTMSCIWRCRVCGKKFIKIDREARGDDDLTHIVDEKCVCYECAYWLNLIANKPDAMQVANGICYQVLPFIEEPTLSMLLGGGGARRFFVTKDREVIKSNDVWTIGKIPERFRDQLPDTGWFCNKSVYGKLLRFNSMCWEAGCLDRYKCFRFKCEIELENGPFNVPPKKWNVGDEHCGYFINTDGIENYVSPIEIKEN